MAVLKPEEIRRWLCVVMKLFGIEHKNLILNDGQDTVKSLAFFFSASMHKVDYKWQENINDVT